MIDALFHALGAVFASGIGVLLLAVVAGVVFVIWDWRLALAGSVLIHLGTASLQVHIHNVPGVVAAGQMAAVLLCAGMLALVGSLHPFAVSPQQAGNWPLRGLALVFIVAAWWFLDPGYTLPFFSLPETELLLWTALCALVMWSFSSSPLFGGIGVLLWSTSLYALAAVLLPGSGLAAVVGIADLFVVLACAYLVLLEPAAQAGSGRSLPRFLPRLRPGGAARPWGLVRRLPPAAGQVAPVQVAPVQVAPVQVAPVQVAPVQVAPVQGAALADPSAAAAVGGAPAVPSTPTSVSGPAPGEAPGLAGAQGESRPERVAP